MGIGGVEDNFAASCEEDSLEIYAFTYHGSCQIQRP